MAWQTAHLQARAGRRSFLGWGAAALALSACSQVVYEAPVADVAAGFEGGNSSRDSQGLSRWWLSFSDKTLNALMDSGMARNLDVRMAVEAINEAAASAAATGAAALPRVDAQGSAQRGDPEATGTISNTSTIGGGISWVVDLFGANLNARRAAAAKLDAAYLTADVARLVLQAGIAQAFIDLRFYQASVALTRRSIESRQSSLGLTKNQFNAGAASRMDVLQAEQLLAEGEAQLPAYETGVDQALARLATLTAQRIATLRPGLTGNGGQPRPRYKAGVGVPADVVRQRPDVMLAERNYAAAVYAVGVAKAQFYPSVTLSGTIGVTDISGGGSIRAWTLGPALSLPIFDAGTNAANLRGAESRAVQARLAWESAVLNAIEEVETSLAAYRRDGRNLAAQQRLVDTSAEAVELAQTNFRVGDGTFFAVLDSERSLFQARQSLAGALRQQGLNYVTLCTAAAGNGTTAG